jgi:hypothetical protein
MKGSGHTARRRVPRPKAKFPTKAKKKDKTMAERKAKSNRVTTRQDSLVTDTSASSDAGSEGEKSDEDSTTSAAEKEDNVVEEDPFAFVGDTTKGLDMDGRGKLCELHSYDSRFNSKGEPVVLRTGSNYGYKIDEEQSPEAAIVQIRYVSHGKVTLTCLKINSPYIQRALREVIGSYPSVNLDSHYEILLHGQPQCLFHYRRELEQYAAAADDTSMKEHVTFCLKYMNKALSKEILAFDAMTQSEGAVPRVNFEDLWMAFKPGCLVYTRMTGTEYVCKLVDVSRDEDEKRRDCWLLEVRRIEFNGKEFGYSDFGFQIPQFDGFKSLADLAVFPLVYHKEYERVRTELLARGKKYVSYSGVHYRKYDGVPFPALGAPRELQGHGMKQVWRTPL